MGGLRAWSDYYSDPDTVFWRGLAIWFFWCLPVASLVWPFRILDVNPMLAVFAVIFPIFLFMGNLMVVSMLDPMGIERESRAVAHTRHGA